MTNNGLSEDPSRDSKSVEAPARRDRLARMVILALCLLAIVQALSSVAAWRSNRDELVELLSDSEREDREDVVQRVRYERSSHQAQLIAARSLVYDVLALSEGASPATSPAVERLPRARELARGVLREEPNSWQASMLLGAATYLDWSLTSDRRLYTAAREWEVPLLKAVREAEGKPEPRRFLVTAYLETWAALSEEKRTFAYELLKRTFREDPEAFDRLASAWIDVAGRRAPEVMPDRPEVWAVLARTYADAHDWRAFSQAHSRYLDSLERKLRRDLDEAAERLRLGEERRSRIMCLNVVTTAPRDARFARLVTQALELYAPGLHGQSVDRLQEWLSWALEMSSISIDPFPTRVISRLTDAIGDLDPPVGAHAALIAEDVYRMERYERLEDTKHGRAWAPFLIAKSRWLVDRGDLIAAVKALDQVYRPAQLTSEYWLARQRVARAEADLVTLGTARERLAELRKRQWAPEEWHAFGHQAKLKLYPQPVSSSPAKLVVEILDAPGHGAAVGIYWDGAPVAIRPVAKGEPLELELEVEPKVHLLEIHALAGGQVYPGRVWLEPRAEGGAAASAAVSAASREDA